MSMTSIAASAHDFEVNGIYYNYNDGASGTSVSVTYKGSDYAMSKVYSGKVRIPETVTYEGNEYSVSSMDSYAFYGCNGLEEVTLPNSMTSMGSYAFKECVTLSKIKLPQNLTLIDVGTFYGCRRLYEIDFSGSVTTIGNNAFEGCYSLTSIKDEYRINAIGEGAFKYCISLYSVAFGYLGTRTLSIGEEAFYGCYNMESFSSGAQILTIGARAFYECNGLMFVKLPGELSLGESAFENCNGLTSVEITGSVASIGDNAFSGCNSLIVVTAGMNEPCSISENAFTNRRNATLYVKRGSKSLYDAATFWKDFKEIVELDDIEEEGYYSAKGGAKEVDGVIWRYSIWNRCAMVDGVMQPTDEDYNSFMGIENNPDEPEEPDEPEYSGDITDPNDASTPRLPEGDVVIPDEFDGYPVVHISGYALERGQLSSLVIPETVSSIGPYAFTRTYLTTITIPEAVHSISSGLFYKCKDLESVNLPSGLTCIGDGAFAYTNLASVTIPNTVTRIGSEAFFCCNSITSITIPRNVTSIGDGAFFGCDNLTIVTSEIETPIVLSNETFSNAEYATLYVPKGTGKLYARTNGWDEFGTIIEIGGDGTPIERDENTYLAGDELTEGYLRYIVNDDNVTVTVTGYLKGIPEDLVIPKTIRKGAYTVTAIEGWVFCGLECLKTRTIVIPESIISIGDGAFCDCQMIEKIWSYIDSPFDIQEALTLAESAEVTIPGVFDPSVPGGATLYVPKGTKTLYESAEGWRQFMNIVEMEEPVPADDVSISSAGMRTFCSEYDLDFTDIIGLKAFIASGFSPSTGDLLLTRVYKVPAGEGLLLKGPEGSYIIPHTVTDMYYMNLLKGVTTATTISPSGEGYTNYILSYGKYDIGFYTLSEEGEIGAGKAYLQLPAQSGAQARVIRLVFDDEDNYVNEENGIETISEAPVLAPVFDLQGRRLQQPKRGLYIVNSKKVFIK